MSTVEHVEATLNAGKKLPCFRIDSNHGKHRVVVGRNIITHFSDFYPTKVQVQYVLDRLNKRYHGSCR